MQFEIQLGTDYSTVTFYNIKVKWDVIAQMMSWFERLGGTLIETNVYQFPSFITTKVIEEVIHNTCFVCGGLMQNDFTQVKIKMEGRKTSDLFSCPIRKCSTCGHSHT